ncbi:hypothetical protein SDC9_145668 [bioreactor metagenome]|uniref:Uncharacterized protein n=1 Tax=bioreactor metagenome TaxID=1076179 RepID=A0A645E9K0_9ZZZZ
MLPTRALGYNVKVHHDAQHLIAFPIICKADIPIKVAGFKPQRIGKFKRLIKRGAYVFAKRHTIFGRSFHAWYAYQRRKRIAHFHLVRRNVFFYLIFIHKQLSSA